MNKPIDPTEPGGKAPENPIQDAPIDIRRIEWLNLLLIALAAIFAFVLHSGATALGVLLGGALMATSFRITGAVMQAVFGRGAQRGWPMVAYWLKFGLLMGLLGVMILVFDVDALGLLLGLSMILVSIVVETLRTLRQR